MKTRETFVLILLVSLLLVPSQYVLGDETQTKKCLPRLKKVAAFVLGKTARVIEGHPIAGPRVRPGFFAAMGARGWTFKIPFLKPEHTENIPDIGTLTPSQWGLPYFWLPNPLSLPRVLIDGYRARLLRSRIAKEGKDFEPAKPESQWQRWNPFTKGPRFDEKRFIEETQLTDSVDEFKAWVAKFPRFARIQEGFWWIFRATGKSLLGLGTGAYFFGHEHETVDQAFGYGEHKDHPDAMSEDDEHVELIYFADSFETAIRIGPKVYRFGHLWGSGNPRIEYNDGSLAAFYEDVTKGNPKLNQPPLGDFYRVKLKFSEEDKKKLLARLDEVAGSDQPTMPLPRNTRIPFYPFQTPAAEMNRILRETTSGGIPTFLDRPQQTNVLKYKLQQLVDWNTDVKFVTLNPKQKRQSALSMGFDALETSLLLGTNPYVIPADMAWDFLVYPSKEEVENAPLELNEQQKDARDRMNDALEKNKDKSKEEQLDAMFDAVLGGDDNKNSKDK